MFEITFLYRSRLLVVVRQAATSQEARQNIIREFSLIPDNHPTFRDYIKVRPV